MLPLVQYTHGLGITSLHPSHLLITNFPLQEAGAASASPCPKHSGGLQELNEGMPVFMEELSMTWLCWGDKQIQGHSAREITAGFKPLVWENEESVWMGLSRKHLPIWVISLPNNLAPTPQLPTQAVSVQKQAQFGAVPRKLGRGPCEARDLLGDLPGTPQLCSEYILETTQLCPPLPGEDSEV